MSGPSRRTFLKRAAGAVPGAALAGSLGAGACAPEGADTGSVDAGTERTGADPALPRAPLLALAEVALPADAIGPRGIEEAVRDFTAWVEAFEAAAELDHPYLTGELRYGPPHPGPRWTAQLEAIELESVRREGIPFRGRTPEERRSVVEAAIRREGSAGMPRSPAQADHVAVGLLAWFYGTSGANDLCYRAEVGRHLCRGIASLPDEPGPLAGA